MLSTGPLAPQSESLATVRGSGAAKSLFGMDFGLGADGTDGADGYTPPHSGTGSATVKMMRMMRVRSWPSRSKDNSMPILRRKVSARRSRPESARGLSSQILDLAIRSPSDSARAHVMGNLRFEFPEPFDNQILVMKISTR